MDNIVWTNEYMEKFGLAFIKYEPLYQKPKSNSDCADKDKKKLQIALCHKLLGKDLGRRSIRKPNIAKQCGIFKRKFMDMLRKLVWEAEDAGAAEQALRAAPPWVRTVEAALQCLPTIRAEANGSSSSLRVVSLLASRLTGQMAREALEQRSVRAEVLAHAHSRLTALAAHPLDGDTVHSLWERVKQVSMGKLAVSVSAGDNPLGVGEGARMEPHDWLVVDALLLYTDTPVISAESYLLYEQLQPLIDVFHLAQMHYLEHPNHPEPTALRWTRAYKEYVAKGLSASLVLLQRRWCELKLWARRSVMARWRGRSENKIYPIHVAVVKRFPHVVTDPLPKWEELVTRGQVIIEPADTGDTGGDTRPPDNPMTSQGLIEKHIETEDDLILIERNIETVELEDEDEILENVDDNDECEYAQKVNDESVRKDSAHDTTPYIEVIVEKECSKESLDINNVEGGMNKNIKDNTNKATGETTDNNDDDNDMQIDDTCIETPAFLDSTEGSLSNVESTVPPTTDSFNETKSISTSKGNIQKDEVDNTETAIETCDQNTRNAEPEKQDYNYEMTIESEPKMIGIEKIKAKEEQEKAVISKLEQLDPDKVETEIIFESDSDGYISREVSPLPSTSGLQDSVRTSDDDSANNSNKKSNFKVDEDVVSNIVKGNALAKVKTEMNESESKGTNLSRFLFVDDVNTVENSESSEDELSIAEIKRKKQNGTLKSKIQFECEDIIQKESNELTPGQRTFAVNIIPLSDLNEIAQSDIQNFLNQDKEHEAEAPEENVSFNFGENIRALSASAPVKRTVSKATKRTQGCNEDSGKRKRTQRTDDEAEAVCGEAGAGGRVAKRVLLPDIEEVRRANGRTPTAQVPPLAPAPCGRPRRAARRKTDVIDEEMAETRATEKQQKRGKRKSRDTESTESAECEEEASTPNQEELFRFLENIADTSRSFMQQQRSGAKLAYCCLARRHRAVNDARRRLAAKAGHSKPPQLLPLHSGAHLKECTCCCVYLVEELARDGEVAAMQRALRGDLADLLHGRRAGAKPVHVLQPRTSSKKSKTQDNKDKDSNGSKIEEKEGNSSAGPNASSGQDSDDDIEIIELVTACNDDDDKLVTSNTKRKKKADNVETEVTQKKESDTGEKKTADPENDPGYQEWIRQKTLNTRYFGLGPPKKNEDKSKYRSKKDSLNISSSQISRNDSGCAEWIRQKNLTTKFFDLGPPKENEDISKCNTTKEDNLNVSTNQISPNGRVESRKQNPVSTVSVDKTTASIEKVAPSLDDQITVTDNHIDANEPFASVKITSITGGAVSNFNTAPAPNSPRVQEISRSGSEREAIQMKGNLLNSVYNFQNNLPLSVSGMNGPAMTAQHRLPSPMKVAPASGRSIDINSTNTGSISGVITIDLTGNKVFANGKVITDALVNRNVANSAPDTTDFVSIPGKVIGTLIPVSVSNITTNSLTITKTASLPSFLLQITTAEKSNFVYSVDCKTTAPNIYFDDEPTVARMATRPTVSTNSAGGPSAPNFGPNAPGASTTVSKSTVFTTAADGQIVSNIRPKREIVPCTIVSKPTGCSVATKESVIPHIVVSKSKLRNISAQSLIASSASGQAVLSNARGRPINSYITYKGPRAQSIAPKASIASFTPVNTVLTTGTSGPTASTSNSSRSRPIVMAKAGGGSSILLPGITLGGQVLCRGDTSVPSEDGSEEKIIVGQRLNAAVIAADQRLRNMKDVKNVQVTIKVDSDMPTVNIKKTGVKKRIIDLKECGVQKPSIRKWTEVTPIEMKPPNADEEKLTPGEKTMVKVTSLDVDSDSDVEEVDAHAQFEEMYESMPTGDIEDIVPMPGTPQKGSGWSSILRPSHEAIDPLWTCLTVERFLEGRDPTTVRLMRVNIERCDSAYLFVTEVEHPVRNSAYCTIAPWRDVQRILFAVGQEEEEDWGVPSMMPHLLGGGCSPDTFSLDNKHYKKLASDPLVYAQVFSMVEAAVDCRRLLMAAKPVWAYCKEDGRLCRITISPIGPNNVGLMCDDNGAVQELVQRLNLINNEILEPKKQPVVVQEEKVQLKQPTQQKQPRQPKDKAKPTGNVIEVVEVESDDDVAIIE